MPDEHLEKRLQELERKWLNNTITPEEAREYAEWYAQQQEDPVYIPSAFAGDETEHAQRMLQQIRRRTGLEPAVVRFRRRALHWTAAAALLALAATGFFILREKPAPAPLMVKEVPANDREPGRKGAILTLADGSEVVLDSLDDGQIATQGATKVLMKGGNLTYAASSNAAVTAYNIITTPTARTFYLVLPDGTKVWLNAASTFRFPVAFTGKERVVEVSGEAYFEVAHDAARPFTVKADDAAVRVLGTHFNIMAYKDEKEIKTTLLEGAVRFTRASESVLLKPGQQSAAGSKGPGKPRNVEVEEVVAWKNGYFNFRGASLEVIMRQVARWYDVEVAYEGKDSQEAFFAEIPRSSRMSDVLKALELTGKVRFRLEGGTLIVQYL